MVQHKKLIIGALALVAISLAGSAFAHTTVVRKNTPSNWQVNDEIEGTGSALSNISIAHGCSSPAGNEARSVTAMSVVWPNGHDALATRSDTGDSIDLAEYIVGNPVMGPKSAQDKDIFKKIVQAVGPTPPYNNHGLRTEDTRAFHYSHGKLQSDLFGLLPYRASYPTFHADSCATKLVINFGIANYCRHTRNTNKDDRADVWFGRLTAKFDDPDVVSVGFWPHVDVVRDLENNPLAESCGDGYAIEVTPSDESLDTYGPIKGYWPHSR